jgi:hypothetical protein
MPCDPEMLKSVPLIVLLDDDEAAVLAAHVAGVPIGWSPGPRLMALGQFQLQGRIAIGIRSTTARSNAKFQSGRSILQSP